MQERSTVQTGSINYNKIKDKAFNKVRVDTLIRGVQKGMSLSDACDLAQLDKRKVLEWMAEYDEFGILMRWAQAVYKETLYEAINDKMMKNSNTAIKMLTELKKAEREGEDDGSNTNDELFDVLNNLD